MTSNVSEFTSMKSVKDMDSTTCWKRLCCLAHAMKEIANTSQDYKKDKKIQKDSKVTFNAPIYQWFWIGILKAVLLITDVNDYDICAMHE